MNSYKATRQYLFSKLPMYQRKGKKAFKKDLTNILKLSEFMGHPHESFPSIHIAGTNGKGSVAHGLAAILQQMGLKVGLYTSPHYKNFRERIKINGKPLSEQAVTQLTKSFKPIIEELQPSFFEITTAMAFKSFAQEGVDIAIIETGLGGRLDATNIITPILSIITNISLDHMDLLGDTLALIAEEKAGIIKKNTPLVIGQYDPTIATIFQTKAAAMNVPLYFADQQFQAITHHHRLQELCIDVYKEEELLYKQLCTDMTGPFQTQNLLTILQAAELLNELGFAYCRQNAFDALTQVKSLTNMIGRWQTLATDPTLILADSGHNEGGMEITMDALQKLDYQQLHFVLGTVKEKNLNTILALLPPNAHYYFCKADIPRGLPTSALKSLAMKYNLKGTAYNSVQEALQAAKEAASNQDLIFIGGSSFVVAEVI